MIVRDAMARATLTLKAQGIEGASRDVRRLLAHAMSVMPDRITLHLSDELTPEQAARFEAAVTERAAFRPVSQITGTRAFWGREFVVTGDVLDPRPETELIIEQAMNGPEPQAFLDLGTGTGILAITLKCHWPHATGMAVDRSSAALEIARKNAERHRADLTFQESDWFTDVNGRFDLIMCNPPYISRTEMASLTRDVREWEPHLALTPGEDGLDAYRVIAASLGAHLTPRGRALFEIGHTQRDAVAAIFARAGFPQTTLHRDLDDKPRVVEVHQKAG